MVLIKYLLPLQECFLKVATLEGDFGSIYVTDICDYRAVGTDGAFETLFAVLYGNRAGYVAQPLLKIVLLLCLIPDSPCEIRVKTGN